VVTLTKRYGVRVWHCDSENAEAVSRLDVALWAQLHAEVEPLVS
jgi:hypothetical protein